MDEDHLQLAVRNDVELSKLLGNVTISQGGALPYIQCELLPAKSTMSTKTSTKYQVRVPTKARSL